MKDLRIDISLSSIRKGMGMQTSDGWKVIPDQEGEVELELGAGNLMRNWPRYRFLILKLRINMEGMALVDACFYKAGDEEPSNRLRYQMIPQQSVTVLVDFAELQSKRYFLKTLPGMLKGMCSGMPISIGDAEMVKILIHAGCVCRFEHVIVEDCWLTNEPPEIRVEGSPMVDAFGQWIQKEWDTKIHSAEELKTILLDEYKRAQTDCVYPTGWSKYGGCLDMPFKKTGFFHLEKTKSRWWLVDPDGYGFFSNGVCYGSRMGVFGLVDGMQSLFAWLPKKTDEKYAAAWTNAGEIPEYVKRNGRESGVHRDMFNFARANMIRVFGADGWWDAWHKINTARLKRWGFNTIGVGVNNYSDERVMEYLEKAEIPFVWTLKEFPQTQIKIFRDFPDVFSKEYRNNAERFAREQLSPFLGNPYMIGYFINNEPEWRFQKVNLAERAFASREELESRSVLAEILREEYGGIEALNRAWNTEFSCFDDLMEPIEGADKFSEKAAQDCQRLHDHLVWKYENTVAEALKKLDPDHLDLGMRYSEAGGEAMAGCGAHDVFSFNCYRPEPETMLEIVRRTKDMPAVIGEYHIGGGDKGNLSHGLIASPNQEERGKALEYYMQRAMTHPCCVGAHYFEMNDQPLLGRFDGEGMEHGLIDICGQEFPPLVEHLIHTNHCLYDWVRGIRKPTEVKGELERVILCNYV